MLTQRKLDQKNHDNEVLQDTLKQSLQRMSHVMPVQDGV